MPTGVGVPVGVAVGVPVAVAVAVAVAVGVGVAFGVVVTVAVKVGVAVCVPLGVPVGVAVSVAVAVRVAVAVGVPLVTVGDGVGVAVSVAVAVRVAVAVAVGVGGTTLPVGVAVAVAVLVAVAVGVAPPVGVGVGVGVAGNVNGVGQVLPDGFRTDRNAWLESLPGATVLLTNWNAFGVTGKSCEKVRPATTMSELESTLMPTPPSTSPVPPSKLEKASSAGPDAAPGVSSLTKAVSGTVRTPATLIPALWFLESSYLVVQALTLVLNGIEFATVPPVVTPVI
jgi:hypothetical protein